MNYQWKGLIPVAALALVLVAGLRILSTHGVFNNTFDEPAHIAAGIEWWDEGTYTHEALHPPLPRVAVALGPYLDGVRSSRTGDPEIEESRVLYDGDRYWERLRLARLGVLPFFLLAVWVVWSWTRELFGRGAALIAVLLFTTIPPVLAHAGLANTDMAITGTLGAALLMFVRWLRNSTGKRSLLFGLFLGLALLTKLSTLLFFPAAAALIWLAKLVLSRKEERPTHRVLPGSVLLVFLSVFVVVWSGYRFSTGTMVSGEDRPHEIVDRVFGSAGTFHDAAYRILETMPLPAPEFFRGISVARDKNENGHALFVLGRRLNNEAVWYFFPVAILVKTPVGFLILIALGGALLTARGFRDRSWFVLSPLLCALALLLVVLPSNINLGLRHILPIFVFLSPVAAQGAVSIFRKGTVGAAVITGAVVWHLGSSAMAHPDHLAYFNEVGGDHPESILVDSDLDWGQDLHRLALELERQDIQNPGIAYFGTASIPKTGILSYHPFPPDRYESGWVAISQTLLKIHIGYAWLSDYEPEQIVGRSIALYRLPEK